MDQDEEYYRRLRAQRELEADTKGAQESVARAAMSSDGRVFGLKLPEPFPTLWTVFGTDAMRLASKHIGEGIGKGVTAVTHSEAKGKLAEQSVRYIIPLAPTAVDAKVIGDTYHKNRKNLVLEPLAPLSAANKSAAKSGMLGSITSHFDSGYSGNKMVEYALGKVTQDTYKDVQSLAIGLVQPALNTASTYLATLENKTAKQAKVEDFIENWGGKIAGAAAAGADKMLKTTSLDEEIGNTSFGKVQALQEVIRVNNLDSPSSVASGGAVQGVAGAVEDIFQTYQKEQGHKPIPSHRMREASKQIAEELISGDLSALSLVNIVGKEKLLTDKKDSIVSSEKIAEVIKQEVAVFSKSSAITSEDFFKDHENFTLDDVKAHLQSKNMDERALVTFLVPESVLIEAGAKKEEIQKLNQHFSKKMQEGIFSAVVKGLASQTDDQLEDKGLSREAIVFVREHEGQGAESIAHVLSSKPGQQQLKELALESLMGEEPKQWQDVIAAGRAAAANSLKNAGHAANDPVYNMDKEFGPAANNEHHSKSKSHAARVRASKEQADTAVNLR